jgi:hypothetical protein
LKGEHGETVFDSPMMDALPKVPLTWTMRASMTVKKHVTASWNSRLSVSSNAVLVSRRVAGQALTVTVVTTGSEPVHELSRDGQITVSDSSI